MVRFWTLWVLGLCLFTQSLTAKEVAGEWILTIDAPRNWEKVLRSLRGGAQWVRFLGKSKRHALVRMQRPFFPFLARRFLKGIQPNYLYHLQENEDPALSSSWALSNWGQMISQWGNGVPGFDIGSLEAWKHSTGSAQVKVAILDSGIRFNHEDLRANLRPEKTELIENGIDDDGNGWKDDPLGWNFISQSNKPKDDNGHGTFCAGILGADWDNGKGSRGLLEKVSLLPIKVLDHLGQGSTATAIEGIEYALKSGAQIANISWGGNQFDPALYQVMKEATEQGLLIVAAAGNSGSNNDDPSESVYPASFSILGLISVAAYDAKGERAAFSQVGKQRVAIGAPGVEVFGTELEGYGFRSGTSFAAPHVTGVAALLKAKFPDLNNFELEKRILETGEPLHFYERNYTRTGKFVSAGNALLGRIPQDITLPQKWHRIAYHQSSEHPYSADSQWSLKIKEPGARFLRLHFKSFETEKKFDWVTLKDQSGKMIYRYSGNLSSFTSAEAIGDEIQLEFSSDFNRQYYGFDIDYIEAAF